LPPRARHDGRAGPRGPGGGADRHRNHREHAQIISLAHALNLRVIAEGVENEEQSKILKLLKCDEGQGYLYGRPVPAGEVESAFKPAAG
jgi:EAL domain-containing protein (putative c-di-GMP-specific phosphodiesterase class I)